MKKNFDIEAATPFAPSPQKKRYEKPEIEAIELEGKPTLLSASATGSGSFRGGFADDSEDEI